MNDTKQISKVRKFFFQSFVKKKISHVPNEVLFRTLSQFNFNFKKAKVLDIGFSSGANLTEIHKRGGEIYGIDLLKKNVSKFKKIHNPKKFFCCDLNLKFPKLKTKLNLIIAKDIIYYLTEEALERLFKEAYLNLKKNSNFFVTFIESCYYQKKNTKGKIKYCKMKRHYNKKNPIKLLKESLIFKLIKKNNFSIKANFNDIILYHQKKRNYFTKSKIFLLKKN